MTTPETDARLREEIIRLGPWHLEVEVTPTLSTRVSLEAPKGTYPDEPIGFRSPRPTWRKLMDQVYPDGLEGRRFLDCACNCGAYCFFSKELGASECLGFDAREHWINQARFLTEHRTWSSDGISFEVLDLYDLPAKGLEPFDVTLFGGIFYHLPDPIRGLQIAADLTRQLLIVNTAAQSGERDGMLALSREGTDPLMSGIHGLTWRPTGPKILILMLEWMGFAEARVTNWFAKGDEHAERLEIVASREKGLLDQLPQSLTQPR